MPSLYFCSANRSPGLHINPICEWGVSEELDSTYKYWRRIPTRNGRRRMHTSGGNKFLYRSRTHARCRVISCGWGQNKDASNPLYSTHPGFSGCMSITKRYHARFGGELISSCLSFSKSPILVEKCAEMTTEISGEFPHAAWFIVEIAEDDHESDHTVITINGPKNRCAEPIIISRSRTENR